MRPHYHYAAAANWLSDPNGLVHHKGKWHLFYQYNPAGDQWGNMAWGHAISRDLVSWTELPPALVQDDAHMIFSGSAVVDHANSAGFGVDTLVAAYTGAGRGPDPLQVQCLASSTDDGRTWHKFPGNPVLDYGLADFRDPNIFWHAATARWIMVVAMSAQNHALILASPDLKHWEKLSAIGPFALPGAVWECPLLIELPVEGGDVTRWMFKVDVLRDGPGSGAVALIGDFDGVCFTPDAADCWQVIDEGKDFYAAIAWHDPRDDHGRPCWIGWMGNHSYQGRLPARGWRGAMSLPKRIGLRDGANGLRIVQTVDPALSAAFGAQHHYRGRNVAATIGIAAKIEIALAPGHSATLSFEAGLVLTLSEAGIAVQRAAALGLDSAHDHDVVAASNGTFTIWLDVASVEIEIGQGGPWASFQHALTHQNIAVVARSNGDIVMSIQQFEAPQ
jgi:fructan beta-fructosidase